MKRIVIVALAALAMTVAFSSGSASAAVVLCKSEAKPCPSSDIQPAGTWFSTAGGTLSIKTSAIKFTCNNFALGSKTLAESGSPLPAVGGGTPFGPCWVGTGGSCSNGVTVSQTNNQLTRLYQHWGMVVIGSVAEPLSISFVCQGSAGAVYECTFAAKESLMLTVGKNESGEWLANGSVSMTKTAGNGFCLGSTATLEYKEAAVGTGNYISST